MNNLLQKFSGGGKNPYQFVAHQARSEEKQEEYKLLPHERAAVQEQHRTLFENDEAMQIMFKHDFEEYFRAIENPDLMIRRMEERMAEIEKDIAERAQQSEDFEDWQEDEFFEDEVDDITMSAREMEDGDWGWERKKDPLREKASQWAQRLRKVGERIYHKQKKEDPDLYRVLINVFLVPAKIAFASAGEGRSTGDAELDAIDAEISLRGYNMSIIFLQRARESLQRLADKKFPPVSHWQAGILAADEIALELQSRIIASARIMQKGNNQEELN